MPDLYDYLQAAFRAAREEHFEDGMESRFARQLQSYLVTYGQRLFFPLLNILVNPDMDHEVKSEALRWLGRQVTYSTQARIICEACLLSQSSMVRDGAALGLASLDNPLSIPALLMAVKQERIPELSRSLQQVVEQLEKTKEDTHA